MDSWERLLLYRKKLILPRIYQVLGWVMWVTYFFAILFLATLVYEHGFMISPVEAKVIRGIYQAVWIVFLLSATIQIIFQRDEEGKKKYVLGLDHKCLALLDFVAGCFQKA